ncbi:Zinc finger protein DZIP1L [Operophtera brumata]|uniref:Zinc finger protein DZIP1L n=1 Tax=Operophtera brumata TaxID=104452 RepID=A0A0L7LDB2_OPEBR|nr:Zinc finger protein DZIP1L [Operophtera brumata]
MAYKTSYELHHHFPRLAEESGFTFNTHRPRVHIDWNKIKLIDLDNLIRERKFVLIEQHLNDILDCVFESEFDVRILDEGVMKMFRLAQLAVEYQQFCRHYLDRSVYVLREEINSLAQELDVTKSRLQEKEDELRKLRKRSRQTFKTPLPYGNDNIAAMILKTLSNKGDIFPSTSNAEVQYNKCKYCDKVFLNQLYLQSHLSRRHADMLDTPQKDEQVNGTNNENAKMNAEIMELKTKLKDMEQIIVNANSQNNKLPDKESEKTPPVIKENKKVERTVRDAEVSTNNEEYLLDKFEQWKKEEHEKYDKEIKLLRTQVLETMNVISDKQVQPSEHTDSTVIEQLHSTLVQQGAELLALKQELINSKIVKQDSETNKEAEANISLWIKRAEVQSNQYDALLQKLNDVARDAKESRALAEAEKERAAQLQALLQQSLQRRVSETVQTSTDDLLVLPKKQASKTSTTENNKPNNKSKQITDRQTLENLHKKAQELLNIGSMSSTSSEASSSSEEKVKPPPTPRKNKLIENSPAKKASAKVPNNIDHSISVYSKYNGQIDTNGKEKVDSINLKGNDSHKFIKASKSRNGKIKSHTKLVKETATNISGSPVRLVRAKLTEEVNNRLVSFGVDPLKSRLPKNVFQKQRMELQQLNEIKSKKTPTYEKVRYSILAYLDANTEVVEKKVNVNHEYVSPSKLLTSVRSISSVISNVKSKALSLVKLNDNSKDKLRSINKKVAKKSMTLLRTPPDSGHESPMSLPSPNKKKCENISYNTKPNRKDKYMKEKEEAEANNVKTTFNKKIIKQPKTEVLNYDTEDYSNESDSQYHNKTAAVVSETSKSIENLIKSPARRPASADINSLYPVRKYAIENGDLFMRTQSATNVSENATPPISTAGKAMMSNENSSDGVESLSDAPIKKLQSVENIQNIKQTKGVLKNASSTSSLNKKKVLFDMDAIQMKSVSASPSQSITEKSDSNEKYELGLMNLDGEEWDISRFDFKYMLQVNNSLYLVHSIENEPLKNDTKIQINTRASPKIAELKKTIESQLARRNDTPSTAIVGGVDILAGPMGRAASIGGSNTSLGSSILDDSEAIPALNLKAFVKPRKVTEKDDSELDISEFSIDGITVTNKNESF